jgi:drug/metabolite transporter (DMT)-like permease
MPFFLAGFASLSFGVADFLGGLATRRAAAVSIVVTSQLIGGTGLLVAAWVVGGEVALAREWAWGAGAGLAGAVGVVLLYHALATTRMSVTAPVTAVFGTASPVVFGIAAGERPEALAWIGIVVGVGSILLIARTPPEDDPALRGGFWPVLYGTVAGLAFGLFGILISRTASESGLWPLVSARSASIGVLVLVAVLLGRPVIAESGRGLAAWAGILDMAANVMYLVAVRQELLSLITVIMAMYPAATVGLARVVLRERIQRIQILGLGLGAGALVLIVLGAG